MIQDPMSSKLQTAESGLKNTCWNSLQILVLFDEEGEEIPPPHTQLQRGQKMETCSKYEETD
jgi:hypothetical protein